MHKMGMMHKMGQEQDIMGQEQDVRKMGLNKNTVAKRRLGKGNMGSMKKANMGNMKKGMNLRRKFSDDCVGLKGKALGRCRAKSKGGCIGLMGLALRSCKANRLRRVKRLTGGVWALVKKPNGVCECTERPKGNIVLGRYHSQKECENHRHHDC